jgi:hypothetical protein
MLGHLCVFSKRSEGALIAPQHCLSLKLKFPGDRAARDFDDASLCEYRQRSSQKQKRNPAFPGFLFE